MTVKQLINMACAYSEISKVEFTRNTVGLQILSSRMNTGKLNMEDWKIIGDALGSKVRIII